MTTTFLAMIIALALHQVLHPGNRLQRDQWLYDWEAFVARNVSSPGLRVALALGALLLLVGWVLSYVDQWLFGLAGMFAAVMIFTWSLGREDYHTALERLQAAGDDSGRAAQAVSGLWMPGTAADLPQAAAAEQVASELSPADGESALRRVVYSGFARWFAPLFYFALTGPLGALLYRATALLAARHGGAYTRLLAWLDWIPARLLVLSFALTGDFLAVARRGPLRHFTDATPAPQLLVEAAGSAGDAAGARAVGDLLYRSAGLWLVLLSIVLIIT